jgi:transposase-like protein
MATRDQFGLSTADRRLRNFSEDFKRQIVSEIERKLVTVSQVSREYSVTRSAIYQWIYKYSHSKKKGVKLIMEKESHSNKLAALRERIKELERLVGQKQIEIEFKEKMIELAEERYGIEIKKKAQEKPLSGSGLTGKRTE